LSRHLRDILGYAFAAAAQASAALLAVPVLTRWLSPSEFGQWSLLEPLFVMVAQISLLGVNHGLLRSVGEDGKSPSAAWRGLLPWVLASGGLTVVVLGLGLWVAVPGTLPLIPFLLALLLEAQSLLALAALRSSNRSFSFASVVTVKAWAFLLLVSCAYAFKFPVAATASNVVWMLVFTTFLGAVAGVTWCWADLRRSDAPTPTASRADYATALRYGAPLMLAGLATAVTVTADRYVLAAFADKADVGRYVVLVKVASAISLLATPLNMWFPSARFKHVKDADGGAHFFRRSALVVFLILVLVAGLLWFAAPALVTLLNPSQGVNKLAIGLLLVGSATTALAGIMNVGILAGGKTQLALFSTLATGVVQIVLLFLLTPIWGVVAAAFSSCVAGCMSLVLQNVLSQRLHRVPYAYGKMFSVAVFALAAICVLSSLDGLGDIARIVVFAIALSLVASATVRFDGFRRQ
jgi:O-antigen/teichoic acid export membrane protein